MMMMAMVMGDARAGEEERVVACWIEGRDVEVSGW